MSLHRYRKVINRPWHRCYWPGVRRSPSATADPTAISLQLRRDTAQSAGIRLADVAAHV